ncbi:861_t:CDS:1, partial [Scutellospora calospora]
VIFWEISSGHKPFKNIFNIDIIIRVSQGEKLMTIKGTPLEYAKLYKRCWDEKPESRPDTYTILKDL